MVPLLFSSSQARYATQPLLLLLSPLQTHRRRPHRLRLMRRRHVTTPVSSQAPQVPAPREKEPLRPGTVFPGGYKRPEIRIPSLVLNLHARDALDDAVLSLVDRAVSKSVGIVLLDGDDASGGEVYEAACRLKSLVRNRAYLLVSERVDIAAAANASGVLLSDRGLFLWRYYSSSYYALHIVNRTNPVPVHEF